MAEYHGNENGGFIVGADGGEMISVPVMAPAAGAGVTVDVIGGSGNDTITGHAGHNYIDARNGDDTIDAAGGDDYIRASAGADQIQGGDGSDTLSFNLASVTGSDALAYTVGSNGDIQVTLGGTAIFDIVPNNDGSFTITGIASTAGEAFGTETISGIERLDFMTAGGQFLDLALTVRPFHFENSDSGWVTGSVLDDSIDLAAEFSGITGSADGSWVQGAGADGGTGNDTVTGTAGSDYIMASAGDDVIDGGDNFDSVNFDLGNATGALSYAVETDGSVSVKLGSETIATVVKNSDGSFTVSGLAGTAGQKFGTERVSDVESLYFHRNSSGAGDTGAFLQVALELVVYRDTLGNGGYVTGTVAGDDINLATTFSGIVPGAEGEWVHGAGADGGAGNDTVTGSVGSDYVRASAGDDVINAGDGFDNVHFDLGSLTGSLTTSVESGVQQIKLDGQTIATVTRNDDGSFTVAGVNGTAGEQFGTEKLTGVEKIFFSNNGDWLDVSLGLQVYKYPNQQGGWVTGSTMDEVIDLAAEFPLVTGDPSGGWSEGAGADAGAGNDTVSGTAGSDYILATQGDDVINGGASSDTVAFHFDGAEGELTHAVDASGDILIKLDGLTVATVVKNSDGSLTVTGVANTAGAQFGTERLTSVEQLSFTSQGGHLFLQLGTQVFKNTNAAGGWVSGSIMGDQIDLGALFPDIQASADGSWVQGAGADGGGGDDTITGSAGSDYMIASAGDDVIDGGANHDNLSFHVNAAGGELSYAATESGELIVLLGATAIATINRNSDGSFIVQGLAGTAGEAFGSERVMNVESLNFFRPGQAEGDNGSHLQINLAVVIYRDQNGNGGYVTGSSIGENIDLSSIFTGIVADPEGDWVHGAGVDAGAGNDTVTGTAGSDYIRATMGADVIHGGEGTDNVQFDLWPLTGELSHAVENGVQLIKLDNTTIATVTRNSDGTFTVAGVAGTAGEQFGTEQLTSIENLYFNANGSWLHIALGTQVFHYENQDGGWVTGSTMDDQIDLAATFPGVTGSADGSWAEGAGADAGAGNDTVTGTAGSDFIMASLGDDVIDGGANFDHVNFHIDAASGDLSHVTNSDGSISVKLGSTTIANIAKVDEDTYMMTGVAGTEGEKFGTERITSVESLMFNRHSGGLGDNGSHLNIQLGVMVWHSPNDNGGFVTGSDLDDTIDMAAVFPGIVGSNDGSWVHGAGADGGAGNDTVTGTAGSDYIRASKGDDVIDGGAGRDNVQFDLAGANGVLALAADDGRQLVQLDGVTIATILKHSDGSFIVAGVAGTAGESLGTERLSNVENVLFTANGAMLDVALGVEVFRNPNDNGGYVRGSSLGDMINLAAEFPLLTGSGNGSWSPGAGAFGGAGNDTITGSAGSDFFEASEGDDVIDGGNSSDTLGFFLEGAGALTYSADQNGVISVKMGDTTVFTLAKNPDGSHTITGIDGTAGAKYGTERISSVESVSFMRPPQGPDDHSAHVLIDLGLRIHREEGSNSGYVTGSSLNDDINLAQIFPLLTSSPSDPYARGAGANGGAGDDTVTGSAGSDHIEASAGNDVLIGGDSIDTLTVSLHEEAGALSYAVNASGIVEVSAAETVIATIAKNADGTFTLTGVAGTSGERFGTEHLSGIESVMFWGKQTTPGVANMAHIELGLRIHRFETGGGNVTGTALGDNVDLAAMFPEIVANPGGVMGAIADLGAGDDTVNGTPGDDHLRASAGNDVMNGGAGYDVIGFTLPAGTPGVLSGALDNTGSYHIKLDSVTIATIVQQENGSIVITGVAGTAGEMFGTETVTNVERLTFNVMGSGNGAPLVFHDVNLGARVTRFQNGGSVTGGVFDDVINLGNEFPGIVPSTTNTPPFGISQVDMGAGDDSVTGTLGSDTILATPGNDVVVGGAGYDILSIFMAGETGVISFRVVGNEGRIVLDGVDIVSVSPQSGGAYLLTGIAGTKGAVIGTELVSGIESIRVARPGQSVSVALAEEFHNLTDAGGRYSGTFGSDIIDIPALYPGIVADDAIVVPGVTIFAGWGNDTVTGSAGRDSIAPSQGDDVIDGGASLADYMVFTLVRSDSGQITSEVDAQGLVLVKRDEQVIFTIEENDNGSFTLTGVPGTEGEWVGTETISNIETLYFNRSPLTNNNNGSFLTLNLAPRSLNFFGEAMYAGSFKSETLDLGAAFPSIVASQDGSPVVGVISEPDNGDDIVIGSAGDDIVIAGAGADSFSGGAGWDRLAFDFTELPAILSMSAFTQVAGENGDQLVKLFGETVLSLHKQADGKVLITGFGMAAEFGTELIGSDVDEVVIDFLDGKSALFPSYFTIDIGPFF